MSAIVIKGHKKCFIELQNLINKFFSEWLYVNSGANFIKKAKQNAFGFMTEIESNEEVINDIFR